MTGDGTQEGSPGTGSNGPGDSTAQPGTQAGGEGASASQRSGDDGSSPLIPILIAIALLAAISVGAVMLRQRRQQGGSTTPASPKAS